jgi:[acyl-carrier-protein] S-malonyltransferase
MEIVALFPGQGSQKPGMGKDLAASIPAAHAAFADVDAALGTSLSELAFEGPADTLTLTQNAQPALFTHGAAVWRAVCTQLGDRLRATAGHSLGELTAYHVAGAFSLADGARLVRRRGELMCECGEQQPGTMAAILCDPGFPIDAVCAEAAAEGGVVVAANYNTPGQVVISGEIAAVERAMELAKARGAKRAIRLNVSGAFHSPLMASATVGLAQALNAIRLRDPAVPVYANVTAEPVRDAATARRLLLEQITAPVRWSDIVTRLAADFPSALFVEMGPGNVLTGLVKKVAPSVAAISCGTAAEVEQLLEKAA